VSLEDCKVIDLPRITDARGCLTVVEGASEIPFAINRAYWLYDVPGGASRAGHAHKSLRQLIISMSGSFDITLDDGRAKRTFHLNRSYLGLYIHPMIWREIDNFSSNAVLLCLASEHYEESDYIREYNNFAELTKGPRLK
jgi:dTDP-4-dehydrorhamnose 3,5-epimerase-like enzyme